MMGPARLAPPFAPEQMAAVLLLAGQVKLYLLAALPHPESCWGDLGTSRQREDLGVSGCHGQAQQGEEDAPGRLQYDGHEQEAESGAHRQDF